MAILTLLLAVSPQRLLGYVKADKLADSLKARLCERFQNVVCEFAGGTLAGPAGAAPAPADQGGAPAPAGCAGGSSYEDVLREWRSLADCIALIPYSEKGMRICMELMRCYKHALGDEHVYQVFKVGV
jgi:condensin complex subunit 1